MIQLNSEEKHYIEKIASSSGESIKTVKNVFRGMLVQAGVQARGKTNRLVIPYICSIDFQLKYPEHEGRRKNNTVIVSSNPTTSFIAEVLSSYRSGKNSPSKEWFRRRIAEKISAFLR